MSYEGSGFVKDITMRYVGMGGSFVIRKQILSHLVFAEWVVMA